MYVETCETSSKQKYNFCFPTMRFIVMFIVQFVVADPDLVTPLPRMKTEGKQGPATLHCTDMIGGLTILACTSSDETAFRSTKRKHCGGA